MPYYFRDDCSRTTEATLDDDASCRSVSVTTDVTRSDWLVAESETVLIVYMGLLRLLALREELSRRTNLTSIGIRLSSPVPYPPSRVAFSTTRARGTLAVAGASVATAFHNRSEGTRLLSR